MTPTVTPLALIGDSHLGAMKRAFELSPELAAGRPLRFHAFGPGGEATRPFFTVSPSGGHVATTAPRWRNLTLDRQSFAGPEGQGALIALSLPLNTARILRTVSWDRHVPWELQLSEAEIPLSRQTVQALIEQDSGHAVAYARAVAALGLSLVVIEGPRCFAHAPYVKRLRPEVCLEIDSRYRVAVGAALTEAGIAVVPQPAGTITPEGFTDPAFRHENASDAHHANAAYGRQVLRAVLAHAARLEMEEGGAAG